MFINKNLFYTFYNFFIYNIFVYKIVVSYFLFPFFDKFIDSTFSCTYTLRDSATIEHYQLPCLHKNEFDGAHPPLNDNRCCVRSATFDFNTRILQPYLRGTKWGKLCLGPFASDAIYRFLLLYMSRSSFHVYYKWLVPFCFVNFIKYYHSNDRKRL